MILSQPRNDLLPVDIHCHGIGDADFTDFSAINLERVNSDARNEGVTVVLTAYLPRHQFETFLRFMERLAAMDLRGEATNIAGVALEGPLLASFGGTPEKGVWRPTKKEWTRLAECGPLGLRYVILSPDADHSEAKLPAPGTDNPSVPWIAETLSAHGVIPAVGHFIRADPPYSADAVNAVVDASSLPLITDHLFNDMPLNFRHSWRGPEARRTRNEELATSQPELWDRTNFSLMAGVVPGRIVELALAGKVFPCLNFDGEHVDFEYSKAATRIIGAENLIAMTDRTDAPNLGGQHLTKRPGETLWYQSGGIVAAGSQPLKRQVENMERMGFDDSTIEHLTTITPSRALGLA